MKKAFILSFLLFFTCFALAQKQKVQVYLKNGSLIKGKVVESWSPDNIKIESNNIIWTFHESEVDTIIVGKTQKENPKIEMPFNFKVEYGVLLGNSDNAESEVSFFQTSFNYGLTENLYAGIGSGVEYYMEQSYIPAFANIECKLRPSKFSPFLFLKAGYLIPGEKQHPSSLYEQRESRNIPPKYLNAKGGILINPGFGFTSMPGKNFGYGLALGYRHHALNFTGKDKYELEQRYNRLSISLSIIFK